MRSFLVAVMVLLSGLAFTSSAQAAEPFLKDAEGDTKFQAVIDGGPASAPFTGGDSAAADLLWFDLSESAMAFDLSWAVKSAKLTAGAVTYETHFAWGEREYVVVTRMSNIPPAGARTASYLYVVDEYYWERAAVLPLVVDADKGVLSVTLDKAYMVDEEGDVPERGQDLEDVRTSAHLGLFRSTFFGEVTDAVPDEGGKPYAVQVGDEESGDLKVDAQNRVRVSNGGSTTFVYRVELKNVGERAHEVDVVPGLLPEGWNVTVQSPVRVDARDDKTITLLASVPFGHKHGGFDAFNLSLVSRADPASRASVRLGVLHTPIPQPAGHHSDLYLHSALTDGLVRVGGGAVSMNTDPAHDMDDPEANPSTNEGGATVWWIPLAPRLAMGLDFDLERVGALTGSVFGRSSGEGTVSAQLLYGPPDASPYDDLETLAEAEAQTLTLDLQAPTAFNLVVTPKEDADYIPYDPEMTLYLAVRLESLTGGMFCCWGTTNPTLSTEDFKLSLPLNEYHDKLSGIAEAAAVIDVTAEGVVEKMARPGTTVTYLFTLRNNGATETTVGLDLAGTDAAAGALVPAEAVALAPKESRKVTLAVQVPAEAKEGEELEVLLFAYAQDDPSKTAIARTKTTVTLGAQAAADEKDVLLAAQSAENETPGPGALAALAALGCALLLTNRRRRHG